VESEHVMSRVGWLSVIVVVTALLAYIFYIGQAIEKSVADHCHENIQRILAAERKLGADFGGYTEVVWAFGLPESCPGFRSPPYRVSRSPYGVLTIKCPNATVHATATHERCEDFESVLMAPSMYAAAK
jgi:hypothetical protein